MPWFDRSNRDSPVRHGWVWLRDDWEGRCRAPLPDDDRAVLDGWIRRGLPLVVARRAATDALDTLRLGLALPDKRRIGLAVAMDAVRDVAPPLPLADAVASAPPAWRDRLGAVREAVTELGVGMAVYGSLAWRHRTGQPYVRLDSDVDLLAAPRRWAEVAGVIAALEALDGAAPRLDGEILLPDGGAVAWRELAGRADRILVKGPNDVALRARADVVRLFADALAPEEAS